MRAVPPAIYHIGFRTHEPILYRSRTVNVINNILMFSGVALAWWNVKSIYYNVSKKNIWNIKGSVENGNEFCMVERTSTRTTTNNVSSRTYTWQTLAVLEWKKSANSEVEESRPYDSWKMENRNNVPWVHGFVSFSYKLN